MYVRLLFICFTTQRLSAVSEYLLQFETSILLFPFVHSRLLGRPMQGR